MTTINFGRSDYLTDYVERFALTPESMALVIVDMQYATGSRNHGLGKRLHDEGQGESVRWRYEQIEERVVPNLRVLLNTFRSRELPVFHITIGSATGDFSDMLPQIRPIAQGLDNRVGHKHHEIVEELRPLPGEPVFNKTTIGAFASTGLDSALRVRGVRQLLIGGISTNACVAATAMAAVDLGYETSILSDGCSAAREDYHLATLESFARLFGRVVTTGQILESFEGGAET